MRLDEVLHPLDEVTTDGTTRARYLANSTSHRATMIRRLLTKLVDGSDSVTDSGRQTLDTWLAGCERAADHYVSAVSEELVDKYFFLGSYTMTLRLMGGEATDKEILQTMNRLVDRAAAPSPPTSTPRVISRSHVTTFSRLGVIKCPTSGTIRLTPKGEAAAEEWLQRSGIDPAALSRRLQKKHRAEATRLGRPGQSANG